MDVAKRRNGFAIMVLLSIAVLFIATFAQAQMPGMQVESKKSEVSKEAAKETVQKRVGKKPESKAEQYYNMLLGEESLYRPVILAILTLLILLQLKHHTGKLVRKYVERNAFIPENGMNFMKLWERVWKFVIAILVIIAMSGSLKLLGLTAGFIGMMLGWSLQQPVTGIAAWLMIVLKKPFQIGDRVVIAGMTGDVTNITLTHVVLNQVGGSIGGEERSGRGILIPNAILFQNVIINYTLEQEFMLDEVPVRLSFDSDWELAQKILLAAAKDVTADIVERTGQDPFIRAEFLEWGILVRLRYNTIPVKRQELSTRIIEILLREFKKNYPTVKFAIPSSFVRYRNESNPGEAGNLTPMDNI